MLQKRNNAIATDDRELTIIRIFDAPRDLVFAAWTEPQHLARWSGPRGFSSTSDKFDLRPGGSYRVCLHAPDGADHWLHGSYREIVAPERLVMTHAWEHADGSSSPETVITVTFSAIGSKTKMVFHQAFFESSAARDGHHGGWSQSFDRLGEYLAVVQSTPSTGVQS